MPNWFGPSAADCGCCADAACGGCNYTRVVLSGITKAGCADCSNLNGTYIFRSASDPWPEDCSFEINIAGLPGVPNEFGSCGIYQLGQACCNPAPGTLTSLWSSLGISFQVTGSGLQVDVFLGTAFGQIGTSQPCGGTRWLGNGHIARFRKTGANCASIGGTIPFISGGPNLGCGDNDYCNTDSATCTLS